MCRSHLSQLRDKAAELAQLDIRVVVVTFEMNSLGRLYVAETGFSWPLLTDESRELYRAYGMLKASFWDIWGLASWRAYSEELLRGNLPKPATGDIHQRGGDVLVDPTGIVQLHYIGQGPADRPEVGDILGLVRTK